VSEALDCTALDVGVTFIATGPAEDTVIDDPIEPFTVVVALLVAADAVAIGIASSASAAKPTPIVADVRTVV
jgi:hypothetical protein